MTKTNKILFVLALTFFVQSASAQNKNIYKKGCIDFNKNGKKDVFEDPVEQVEKRVANLLSQMTLEEKTCQTATLYGYKRVLKEEMPAASWKNEVWKDGISNIDEKLNNLDSHTDNAKTQYGFPYSKHAEAINAVQKWFVEQARLRIPVDFTNEGTVTVDVTNTGKIKGDDVVQLYLKDEVSSVTNYEYDLRGF